MPQGHIIILQELLKDVSAKNIQKILDEGGGANAGAEWLNAKQIPRFQKPPTNSPFSAE